MNEWVRCIDLILKALSMDKNHHNKSLLSLLDEYFNKDHIAAIIGFQLSYYKSSNNITGETPYSLMKVVAILIETKILSFDSLMQYVSIYLYKFLMVLSMYLSCLLKLILFLFLYFVLIGLYLVYWRY